MDESVEVGPVGDGTYAYQVNNKLSAERYANRASALHAAMKEQVTTPKGLIPIDHPNAGVE